jgi:hypothetical protein
MMVEGIKWRKVGDITFGVHVGNVSGAVDLGKGAGRSWWPAGDLVEVIRTGGRLIEVSLNSCKF